ncbi:hypothetical protein C2845_PM02G38380 [Panicum miliaceum]|uniref:CCHC-type domain-containing protein n=1 Tax=Panicum miliaceum TaxID=4540 RepID=A0A3L6SF57_PANMI|nr:hypothetical protein C2845_PM02G38380 [Panicum miliaceum]
METGKKNGCDPMGVQGGDGSGLGVDDARKEAEEEEEYAFEDDEEAVQMPPRWMAVARYYSEGFARALGGKIGRVLEVGQAANNYKRVRVDFALEKIIMRMVQQKVQGHDEMEFLVRYENIPNFCFGCGRIGHDQRECPDEGLRNRDDQVHNRRRCREEEREAGDATFGAHMGIPIEISEELVAGVKKMGMDHVLPDLNQQPLPASPERVSGRSATETASASHLSMRDRLLLAKNSREGVVDVKKNEVEVKVAAKETEKQKRSKKATHANIAASIKEQEKHGLDTEVNQIKREAAFESQATSSAPDGARKLWSHVWSGRVPPKVNMFIWKLARDNLPTRRAKFIRRLEPSDMCPLCDHESETSYHATVTCPRAVGLRMAMRDCWHLPEEVKFRYTGPDWLLMLLDQCTEEERNLTKLLL